MNNAPRRTRFYMRRIDNLLNVQKIVTIHYQELSRATHRPKKRTISGK